MAFEEMYSRGPTATSAEDPMLVQMISHMKLSRGQVMMTLRRDWRGQRRAREWETLWVDLDD